MKVVLEYLEFTWWQFHIKMMDESDLVRQLLPHLRDVWNIRHEIGISFVCAMVGFPVGLLIVYLQSVVH